MAEYLKFSIIINIKQFNRYFNLLIFILISVFFCYQVFSQDFVNTNSEEIYVINSFIFIVDGITKPFALNQITEFYTGEEITGYLNLLGFLQRKTQLLNNQRLFESIEIDYSIVQKQDDGNYPVDLIIYIKDSWNFIILPYPKYDSNSGLELVLKLRDFNFLGTMQPLKLDLGYKYTIDKQSIFSLNQNINYPFEAFALKWDFVFNNDLEYHFGIEKPFYFKNITGLYTEFPVLHSALTVGISKNFIYNDDNYDGFYISSIPQVSWSLPTGILIGNYNEIIYNAELSAVFNLFLPSEFNQSPLLIFFHNLEFEYINWKGNFRQGFFASFENSYSYNFYNLINDLNPWIFNFNLNSTIHYLIIDDILGISAKFLYNHWINSSDDKAGMQLRGVYNNQVVSQVLLLLNFDLHIRALRVLPSHWFPNILFMRVFDFDLHLNPVFDFAWYKHPDKELSFLKENFLIGAGFEIIVFPHRFRNMFLRFSAAWNLYNVNNSPVELFLGMDLHY